MEGLLILAVPVVALVAFGVCKQCGRIWLHCRCNKHPL